MKGIVSRHYEEEIYNISLNVTKFDYSFDRLVQKEDKEEDKGDRLSCNL